MVGKIGYYIEDTGDPVDEVFVYFMGAEPPAEQYILISGVWTPLVDPWYLMDKIIGGDVDIGPAQDEPPEGVPPGPAPATPNGEQATSPTQTGELIAGGPGSGRYPKGSGGQTERLVEKNMQAVLDRAKASGNFAADASWYAMAHGQVAEHAQKAGIEENTFAGMVSATSPQVVWETSRTHRLVNIELAEKAAAAARAHPGMTGDQVAAAMDSPGMLKNSLANAIDIHNGVPVDQVLKGPKTRSFYNNLIEPKGTANVTIDTHMARAMAGDPTLDAQGIRAFTQGKNYAWSADQVRKIAAANNISPVEAQAAIWSQWKRENPS